MSRFDYIGFGAELALQAVVTWLTAFAAVALLAGSGILIVREADRRSRREGQALILGCAAWFVIHQTACIIVGQPLPEWLIIAMLPSYTAFCVAGPLLWFERKLRSRLSATEGVPEHG